MSKPIPTIQKFMTANPLTIGDDQPMAAAHRAFRDKKIRHLPVLKGGRLVGIVSDRDLNLIESLQGVDPNQVQVADAMTPDPYTVSPSTPLDEVVSTMALHKYGCVIVVDHHHVVGIFTTVDVCRAFEELLHSRLSR